MNLRLIPTVALCCIGLPTAQAQTPPIKPGLWQVHSEREVDGKKMPDMSERMHNMPPEARQRMEAMMKQHGVDMGGGMSAMKLCLSKDSLDRGQWQGQHGNCKTDVTSRSNSSWKWHSSCTQPPSESDGEAVFADNENYTVKTRTQTTLQGQARTSAMTLTAKWQGADCGDLKPIAPFKAGSAP